MRVRIFRQPTIEKPVKRPLSQYGNKLLYQNMYNIYTYVCVGIFNLIFVFSFFFFFVIIIVYSSLKTSINK